jgi:hypothetical protein
MRCSICHGEGKIYAESIPDIRVYGSFLNRQQLHPYSEPCPGCFGSGIMYCCEGECLDTPGKQDDKLYTKIPRND